MCECNNQDEERSVTRLQNRALRTVNRLLRRKAERIQQQNDETIAVLFEPHETEAESALREIWEKTGMLCSPDDYEEIVRVVVMFYERMIASADPVPH